MAGGFRKVRDSESRGTGSGRTGRYGASRDDDRTGMWPPRKKVCRFCSNHAPTLDYKVVDMLPRFLTENGKIMPRRITGVCSKHQRRLAASIKRSRHGELLAFQGE